MSTENREVARREVRRVLAEKGMTNAHLASAADVDAKTINSFLATSNARWPQRTKRAAIARALGWPASELDHIDDVGSLSPAARDEYGPADWLPSAEEAGTTEELETIGKLFRLVPLSQRENALRDVFRALARYMEHTDRPGQPFLSVAPSTTEDALAAHDEEGSIAGEQEQPTEP